MSTLQDRILEVSAELPRGWQAKLARVCGIKPPSVSDWVTGKTLTIDGENLLVAADFFKVNPQWLSSGKGPKHAITGTASTSQGQTTSGAGFVVTPTNAEYAGIPRTMRATPVVGTAKMGDDGYYEELQHPPGHGDGVVDGYSSDPNAYALRVKGDSMHPAIRHGQFVVVDPNGQCIPGEYVVISLLNGKKMVKELVIERPDEIVIESVNGNHRQTIAKTEIEKIHPVGAVVAASKWRSE